MSDGELHGSFQRLKDEIHKSIVGQEYLIERLLIALLSKGHILLEGVPGLAKTKTLSTLTTCISAEMNRVPFTSDLLPSDLIGTEVFRPQSGEFLVRKGPLFANFVLADEINRAPAKVQSALLQAMQEREVTIGETTFPLPDPFLVLATQNPIEQEGTYPLPEAQLDRFLMKVKVTYPTYDEELALLRLNDGRTPSTGRVMDVDELKQLSIAMEDVYLDQRIDRYIVSLVQATRQGEAFGLGGLIDWGASPRASLGLRTCARSLAFLRGKEFVTPDHVKAVAPDVLRHRIVVSFEAEAKGVDSDQIIRTLLESVTVP